MCAIFPTDTARNQSLMGKSITSICGSGPGHSKGDTFPFQIPARPRRKVRR